MGFIRLVKAYPGLVSDHEGKQEDEAAVNNSLHERWEPLFRMRERKHKAKEKRGKQNIREQVHTPQQEYEPQGIPGKRLLSANHQHQSKHNHVGMENRARTVM